VFLLVKQVARFQAKHEAEVKAAPVVNKSEVLLEEIRDLLKSKP
jgi:large-conductance mechanosensitive channel